MHAALPSPNQGSVGTAQVVFDGSKTGLSWPANPPSSVSRRSPRTPGNDPGRSVEMTKKRKDDGYEWCDS